MKFLDMESMIHKKMSMRKSIQGLAKWFHELDIENSEPEWKSRVQSGENWRTWTVDFELDRLL